jgi:hypothetical protein
VLLNLGDGTFAEDALYGTGNGPRSVAIGDLDGDGDADLAVANEFSDNVSVLLNLGGGVSRPGDLTGDGLVGLGDLLVLLAFWGGCSECNACPPDFDGDCTVDFEDLLVLLQAWS